MHISIYDKLCMCVYCLVSFELYKKNQKRIKKEYKNHVQNNRIRSPGNFFSGDMLKTVMISQVQLVGDYKREALKDKRKVCLAIGSLQNQEAASLFTNMFTSSSEKRVRPNATAASCRTWPETIPLRTPSRALSVSAV